MIKNMKNKKSNQKFNRNINEMNSNEYLNSGPKTVTNTQEYSLNFE